MHRTTEDANDILVRVCLGFLRVFSGDRGNNPGNLRLSGHCSRPRVPCDRKPRPEETQDFLQDLTDKITQPQFCYAHEYKKGDLLIIDDRASLHKAGFDYDHSQHRRLYRMLVRGDRPY